MPIKVSQIWLIQIFFLTCEKSGLKASTIKWWGKRRWQIEGFFKTAKHRFGLHRFGQGTLLGIYRWLILSFTAYFIAHWTYLSTRLSLPPDWGRTYLHIQRQPSLVDSLLGSRVCFI